MNASRPTSHPWFYAFTPDPFQACLALSLVAIGYAIYCHALASLRTGEEFAGVARHVLAEGWARGLLSPETQASVLQTIVLLVVGAAVVSLRVVQRGIDLVAAVGDAGDGAWAAAVVAAAAILTGWLHLGVSLLASALIVRRIVVLHARRPDKDERSLHFGLLAVAGYSGLLVCHSGFSGWIAQVVLDPPTASLAEALFSQRNLVAQSILFVAIPVLFMILTYGAQAWGYASLPPELWDPVEGEDSEGLFLWPLTAGSAHVASVAWAAPLAATVVAACACRAAAGHVWQASQIGMFALSLIGLGLIWSAPNGQRERLREAAAGAAPMLLQIPLYGALGAMLVLVADGLPQPEHLRHWLSENLQSWFASRHLHQPAEASVLSAYVTAGLANLFAPCEGALRMLQDETAQGAKPAVLLAIAWGAQATSLLQPLWFLPGLGITRADPRELLLWAFPISGVTAMVYFLCLVFI